MILPGEVVFVVDFCFSEVEMVALDLFANLTWIDHHKSSLDTMAKYEFVGLQKIGLGACELTWMHLYPEIKIPTAIFLLGAYDTWRFHGQEQEGMYANVVPFQYGLRAKTAASPASSVWEILLSDCNMPGFTIDEICEIGQIILDYENQTNAKIATSMAFECEFHGYNAIAMNRAWVGSAAFDNVYDPTRHDIMILFSTKGDGKFKHSLFCNKPDIDVSGLAKKYPGGGGHAGAAGFTTDSIQVAANSETAEKVA